LNLVLLFAIASLAVADVTVTGVATVSAKPDMVSFTATVVTENLDSKIALAENNKKMNEVFKVLDRLDIPRDDCETVGFGIAPKYFHPDDKPKELVAYVVTNSLLVRVNKSERRSEKSSNLQSLVGNVMNDVISDGVQVEGVSFGIRDTTAMLKKATVAAVNNAREKANLFAVTAGVHLGPAKTISEVNISHKRPPIQIAAAGGDTVPILVGDQKVTVTVNITFHIMGEIRNLHNDNWR